LTRMGYVESMARATAEAAADDFLHDLGGGRNGLDAQPLRLMCV
jgi:hypothetical protein